MNTGIKLVYIPIYYHCNKNQQILFEPKTPQSPLITEFTYMYLYRLLRLTLVVTSGN